MKERPAMQDGALRLPSPHRRANMLEVFKCNRALRALSLPYQALADRVVGVFGEAGFLTRQSPKPSLCRQRTFFLEPVSQATMSVTHVLDGAAAVNRAVRVRRKQIACTLARCAHLALPLAADKRDGLPTVECPDRHLRLRQGKRQDAVVIGDARQWAERALDLRIPRVGAPDLCQRPDRHLRRQAELRAYLRVTALLKRQLAKDARFPGHIADEAALRQAGPIVYNYEYPRIQHPHHRKDLP